MTAALTARAETQLRDAYDRLTRAGAEGDVEGYDAAWMTLALAVGRTPDEAAEGTLSGLVAQAQAETRLPTPARPRLRLVPPLPDDRTPVEQLAAGLASLSGTRWNAQKVGRLLRAGLIPGTSKADPTKAKSRWIIPNPTDSARRFLDGERGNRKGAS